MDEDPLTFNQIVQGIADFIEVAIHTILYIRRVYPAELFIRRKKYDTPVFQSRHPALNEYISGAVKAVADELAAGNVEKVVVIIKDKDNVALERYVFAVQNMIQVEAYNKDTSVLGAMTPTALGQYFRAFMAKLSLMENQLGQLSLGDEGSFAVVIELRDDKAPSVSQGKDPPPWVPATTPHTTRGVADQAELHMVRSVDTGIINISLAVQESEAKLNMQREHIRKGKQRAV
ncbi:DNA-binding protein [Phanerochaete sordida]|uniref:DNA-binding protein n=1 Tax=Phanerochaete sordida TaxID=48140 RepID=A0A9P3L9C1_9APHY|nr:DNA-binding protein [Phanerochaete sordida]